MTPQPGATVTVIAELEARLAAARAIHVLCPSTSLPWCLADGRLWPCPTIRALDGPDDA